MDDAANGISEPIVGLPLSDGIEAEAQAKSIAFEIELRKTREILTTDMLCSLVAPRARMEQHYAHLQAYFFTIDGVLNGRKVQGALFAGECILIFALGDASAQDLANRGLRTTIELAIEEFDTRNTRIMGKVEAGLTRDKVGVGDAGGRRARQSRDGKEALHTAPMLRSMIEHEIGGLPWKW